MLKWGIIKTWNGTDQTGPEFILHALPLASYSLNTITSEITIKIRNHNHRLASSLSTYIQRKTMLACLKTYVRCL